MDSPSEIKSTQLNLNSVANVTREPRFLWSLFHQGIIDFYIIRQFLVVFVLIFSCLSLFFVVMDFMNDADMFIQQCKDKNLSFWYVITSYYGPRILGLYDQFLGFFVILSGIITMSLLLNRMELTGMTSMGIPRYRAAAPILFVAVILVLAGIYNRDVVLPSCRSILNNGVSEFFSQSGEKIEPKSDPMTSVYINGKQVDRVHQTIVEPNISLPIGLLDQYGRDLHAQAAVWKPPVLGNDMNAERPAGFLLQDVSTSKNEKLDSKKTLYLSEKPILITPLGNPWLKSGECFLVSSIIIDDLTIGRSSQQYAKISELRRAMQRTTGGMRLDAAVLIHQRIARPFIDLALIFIGMSTMMVACSSTIVALLKAVFWSLVCLILMNMFQFLGGDGIILPALAGWMPFVVIAVIDTYIWDDVYGVRT